MGIDRASPALVHRKVDLEGRSDTDDAPAPDSTARLRDDPSAGQQLIDAFYRGEFEAEWNRQYAIANLSATSWDEHVARINARNGFASDERVLPTD